MDVLFSTLVTAIATGCVPLIVATLAYRQARVANRQAMVLEERKVDAEAYARAQGIYRNMIEDLERQLGIAQLRITELERRLSGGLPPRTPLPDSTSNG